VRDRVVGIAVMAVSACLGGAAGLLWSFPGENASGGSIRGVRGIEGIETVTLQNLEAVLRMQDRSSEDRAQGAVRAAASLLWTEDEPGELEEIPDGREEMAEFELEGS
jgi:hypothetical protein